MSKIGITLSLDVTKIDKTRLYKGAKGTYLDLTTFIDVDSKDQYENNGFITQSQTKEERESDAERPPILGNVKVFYSDGPNQAFSQGAPQAQASAAVADEDIPF